MGFLSSEIVHAIFLVKTMCPLTCLALTFASPLTKNIFAFLLASSVYVIPLMLQEQDQMTICSRRSSLDLQVMSLFFHCCPSTVIEPDSQHGPRHNHTQSFTLFITSHPLNSLNSAWHRTWCKAAVH